MDDLNYLLVGGWHLALVCHGTDAYEITGAIGKKELEIHGRTLGEAVDNFTRVAKKFEFNENERLAAGRPNGR